MDKSTGQDTVTGSGDAEEQAAGGPDEVPQAGSRRARAVTAAITVLAALVGLGVFAAVRHAGTPDGMGAVGPAPTESAPPVRDVDWRRAAHPLECGELPLRVLDVDIADLVGGDGPEAVVVLRCDAGAGSPPSTVFVYDRRSSRTTPPTPIATLLAGGEDLLLNEVDAEDGVVRGEAFGYSGPGVPRCCPDRHDEVSWQWTGTEFRRETRPLGG
ncbi:MAG: hypothetical protein ACRDYU_19560 [Actinomycetes bacterium]